MIPDFISSLKDNPYFGAGFGLVGLGTGLALLRKASQYAFIYFRRRYVMTLEIPSKDKSYHWVLRWITTANKKSQHLSVDTQFKQFNNGKVSSEFNFIPSLGNHFFFYRGTWIKMERTRESNVVDLNTGTPWESLTLTTLGTTPNLYKYLLEEAKVKALKSMEGKTVVYTALGTDWRPFGFPRKKRPINSVILDKGIAANIIGDIQEFIQNPIWYNQRGIPYRRGYLLYGPPGCGKSSFIQALAGEINHNICILNLSERGLTDDRLNHLLSVAPEQSILLLEDIDAVFDSREENAAVKKKFEGLTRITFSGLLNALDGVAASEARILFMTTNYYDRLDPALIRPGRVDFKQYVGPASDHQITEMFRKFYPECEHHISRDFLTQLKLRLPSLGETGKDINLTPAQLQGYFVMFKDSPEKALASISSQLSQLL
ncbi:unnamed protein product [Gordionus sp. m RMFG-2023]|uniref:mitochondrial chaperone BCS1-like n=1 Tax=Gordionus sp. m RMFG-2023 TaxID=3053472 RepID=UPI0030E2AC20